METQCQSVFLEEKQGGKECGYKEEVGHWNWKHTQSRGGFSQHVLSVLAFAFCRRHSSLGKCQGSFFTIPLRTSAFCAHGNTYSTEIPGSSFPQTGSELRCPCEKGMEMVSSPWGGLEGGHGQETPDLDPRATAECRSGMDLNTWHHRLGLDFSECSWANGKVNIGFLFCLFLR